MEAAQEIIKSYGKSFLNQEHLQTKVKVRKKLTRRFMNMSLHTVNIDRDQARLYDLIWKEP
jgi:DNA topoisomerase-1